MLCSDPLLSRSPLYLLDTLQLEKTSIATVPLVIYAGGLLSARSASSSSSSGHVTSSTSFSSFSFSSSSSCLLFFVFFCSSRSLLSLLDPAVGRGCVLARQVERDA